ncbi:hypothetical protein M405DRAFT_887897 [Rhizopogon salebrosus TDB-379]|nr:hypothetical protein M405DRAFT_887897 [Rhizopogon salebrosus TDB-379]
MTHCMPRSPYELLCRHLPRPDAPTHQEGSYALGQAEILESIFVPSAATSGVVQEILVQVQDTNGKEQGECTFKGLNEPLAVRGGVAFQDTEAVVITADNNSARQLKINFKAGSGAKPVQGFKKDKYRTEDGPRGGNDYHDTTLVVSFIKMTNNHVLRLRSYQVLLPGSRCGVFLPVLVVEHYLELLARVLGAKIWQKLVLASPHQRAGMVNGTLYNVVPSNITPGSGTVDTWKLVVSPLEIVFV